MTSMKTAWGVSLVPAQITHTTTRALVGFRGMLNPGEILELDKRSHYCENTGSSKMV